MKTTLQAGMRILISRYLSSRGCGDTVYVTDRQESSAHRRQLWHLSIKIFYGIIGAYNV